MRYNAAQHSLVGLTLLNPRPESPANQEFSQQLQNAGATVINRPVIAIEPVDVIFKPLNQIDYLIVTSLNAVVYAETYLLNLPKEAVVIAIGTQTAEALKRIGRSANLVPETPSSEGILSSLDAITDKHIVILKGEGGRDKLRRACIAAKAKVFELAVYKRIPLLKSSAIDKTIWHNEAIQLVTASSIECVQAIEQLAEINNSELLKHICWVAISARVASYLKEQGYNRTVTADNANLFAAITRWWQQGQG